MLTARANTRGGLAPRTTLPRSTHMASTTKEPWEKKRPAKPVKHLSSAQKTKARASAKKSGRATPSLVDNMNAAKKKPAAKTTTAKKSTAKKTTAKKSTKKRT